MTTSHSAKLSTLLINAMKAGNGADFIKPTHPPTEVKYKLSPPSMSNYIFDIPIHAPLIIPQTASIKAVRSGRLMGGPELLVDAVISKISIYPDLSPSTICIKYGEKKLHVSGCKSDEDIRRVIEYIKPMEPGEVEYVQITASANLGVQCNLNQIALNLARKIHSPVPEPNKSRLTVQNINNLGGSLTFFSKGGLIIIGTSVDQIHEMHKSVIDWIS